MSHSTTDAQAAQPSWGTVAEAAELYRVSPDTIRRMIRRGEVYAERFGPRLIRIDLNSFKTHMLSPQETQGAQA